MDLFHCGRKWQKVAAYLDGYIKVYELLDPMELKNWLLQAEFQNVANAVSKFGRVSCSYASISWIPQKVDNQQLSFVVGFNSDRPQLNSAKVWEFDQVHQRWLPVAGLALSEDNGDPVYAVAWAPNIGRGILLYMLLYLRTMVWKTSYLLSTYQTTTVLMRISEVQLEGCPQLYI